MPRYSIPEGAAEPRATDPIPGGPQCPPLHPFAHKEPRRFDHRLGGAARTTLIAAPPLNPVDQAGHQTACRSSPRPSPVSIAQESWAHARSLAAAVAAKSMSSALSGFLKTVPYRAHLAPKPHFHRRLRGKRRCDPLTHSGMFFERFDPDRVLPQMMRTRLDVAQPELRGPCEARTRRKAHKRSELIDRTIWHAFEAERPELVPISRPFGGIMVKFSCPEV